MSSATQPIGVIARLLDLSERRVQQLSREGVIPKAERGQYDLIGSVRGYVRYLRDQALKAQAGAPDYAAERARFIRARADLAEMEAEEDKQMFMEEYNMKEPALNRLIQTAYRLLNLDTYFTAGVQEVRAWTIHKGWKAPQAASVIHTDFEKGFIKAEVIAYDDYVQLGSEAACRDNGKLRIEGKEYLVKDGDIMHFRFNV